MIYCSSYISNISTPISFSNILTSNMAEGHGLSKIQPLHFTNKLPHLLLDEEADLIPNLQEISTKYNISQWCFGVGSYILWLLSLLFIWSIKKIRRYKYQVVYSIIFIITSMKRGSNNPGGIELYYSIITSIIIFRNDSYSLDWNNNYYMIIYKLLTKKILEFFWFLIIIQNLLQQLLLYYSLIIQIKKISDIIKRSRLVLVMMKSVYQLILSL
eukprot:469384_1